MSSQDRIQLGNQNLLCLLFDCKRRMAVLISARMTKAVTADILAKQIKVLQNQLFNAKAHFEIYMGLGKIWDQHIREIQDSPVFWQFTMRAHIDTAMLYLCRTYDSNKQALQLAVLLENIEENPSLFCEAAFRNRHKRRPGVDGLAQYTRTLNLKQLSQDRDFCDRKNPLISNLRHWRNNLIAHFNHEEALRIDKPMHERHPLPFEHMRALIETGLAILNRYSSLLDATEHSTQFASNQGADYTYILDSVRFARIGREWNRRRIRTNIRRKLAQAK